MRRDITWLYFFFFFVFIFFSSFLSSLPFARVTLRIRRYRSTDTTIRSIDFTFEISRLLDQFHLSNLPNWTSHWYTVDSRVTKKLRLLFPHNVIPLTTS
ncbi:hypothetical protein ANTRET_LOCUS8599 [Anthophora retusa]